MKNIVFKNFRLRPLAVALVGSLALFSQFAHAATAAPTVTYQYQKYIKGLPPEVPSGGASPAILNFGEVQIPGSSPWQTVTFTNNGNVDLTVGAITPSAGFEVQGSCPATLSANQSCPLQVRFTPTVAGAANGTLSIESSAYNSPGMVALQGQATQPVATFAPNPLNLGSVDVGTASAPASLSIYNSGTGILTVSSLTFTGGSSGFAVAEGSCGPLPKQMASNESCALSVSVSPTATGALSGSVNVATNDAAGSHSIPLQATGVQAAIALAPASLSFGDVLVGTSSTAQTLTVTNNGSGALNIASVTRTGANAGEFATTNTCGSPVAPNGGSCTITVTASPTSKGAKTAAIEIVSNAPTSPTTASLSANATQGTASVNPTSWDFGTVTVGP